MTDDERREDVVVAALNGAIEKTHELMRRERERAYRRALKATGHTPGSIEVMLRRDRHWLDTGTDEPNGSGK